MATINGFITNLGKYNEGELVGEWITFPIDEEELKTVYERIGIDGKYYEESFFTDWDCNIELSLGEYESIENVNNLAEQLETLDGNDLEKLEAIQEVYGYTLQQLIDHGIDMDDYIYYPGQTLEDVAYDLVEECYFTKETPDIFTRYFDYEAFARDLSFDGYTETKNGVLVSC